MRRHISAGGRRLKMHCVEDIAVRFHRAYRDDLRPRSHCNGYASQGGEINGHQSTLRPYANGIRSQNGFDNALDAISLLGFSDDGIQRRCECERHGENDEDGAPETPDFAAALP